MKKIVSILLSLVLVFSLVLPSFAANSDQDIPIVYVRGQGASIYDAEGNDIASINLDVNAVVKQVLEALAKTYATRDYSYASDCLADIIESAFPALGKDGELIADEQPPQSNFAGNKSDFGFDDYAFSYDWRLDPIYNGELLAAHIDRVLEYTGASKVALISFSEGSCVCGAYLTYHRADKVDSYTMISPGCNGIDVVGALAAGKCKTSATQLDKFITYYVEGGNLLGNSALEGLISVFASTLKKINILGYGAAFLQDLYDGLNENIAFSDIVLGCYPGFWSFVSDEYYDDAIEKNFAGREDEFAPLIAKIEKYHNEVFETLPETLDSLKAGGMKLNVIAKYGSAPFPIVKGNDVQSDGVIELHNTSFGATSAKLGETLTGVDAGSRYVSPDKVIDASTCRYKDSTWFVQGIVHGAYSEALEDFAVMLTKSTEQVTIDDHDQFMQYGADDSLSPLAADNGNSKRWKTRWIDILQKFIGRLLELLKSWVSKLLNK